MSAVTLAGFALILGLLAVAAAVLALLWQAGRDRAVLARLTTIFAILTLIGVGISTVLVGYALLLGSSVEVTVPLEVVQARPPEGVTDAVQVATVISGGADRATLVVSGLTLPTRLLLLVGALAGNVTIGAVAVVALRAARALRDGDIFDFAPRAIMVTAGIVVVGGLIWSIVGDIGSWRAGVEALQLTGWGAEGTIAEELGATDVDPQVLLAQHGWLAPAGFTLTIPFWPLSVGLGLALVGTAFRAGRGLRTDVAHLKDDVRGLV